MQKSNLLKIFLVFLALLFGIMLVDKLIGANTGWFDKMGDYPLYNSALEPTAAFNQLYLEIWFAETLAFILLPFALVGLRKWIRTNLTP